MKKNNNSKMTVVLELYDKQFKTVIIKMFYWAIMNTLEANENIKSLKNRRYLKNEMEILKLKNNK